MLIAISLLAFGICLLVFSSYQIANLPYTLSYILHNESLLSAYAMLLWLPAIGLAAVIIGAILIFHVRKKAEAQHDAIPVEFKLKCSSCGLNVASDCSVCPRCSNTIENHLNKRQEA